MEYSEIDETLNKKGSRPCTPCPCPEENRRDILIAQLIQTAYECMVCYEKILPRESIWSCSKCFSLFHLNCIQKWARTSIAAAAEIDYDSESSMSNNDSWRCPGCQSRNTKIPKSSRCFCGFMKNPEEKWEEYMDKIGVPHSCGNQCNRNRKNSSAQAQAHAYCDHPCEIPCHPGPCPPCSMRSLRTCKCGKTTHEVACTAANDEITTCQNICEGILNCEVHKCGQPCHVPPCRKCPIINTWTCHCGKQSTRVPCSTTGGIFGSKNSYSCRQICNKEYNNGMICERVCHSGNCRLTTCDKFKSLCMSKFLVSFLRFCFTKIFIIGLIVVGLKYYESCSFIAIPLIFFGSLSISHAILQKWLKSFNVESADTVTSFPYVSVFILTFFVGCLKYVIAGFIGLHVVFGFQCEPFVYLAVVACTGLNIYFSFGVTE